MERTVGLCLLAVCVVWQSSASPAIILRRLHRSNETVTPKNNHSSASPKEAAVTNQSSVSLSVILKDLENSNANPMAATDKNCSKSLFVTPKNRAHRQRRPRITPDKNQISESALVTLKNQEYNKDDTKEVTEAEWLLEESSESPLVIPEDRDNNDVDSKEKTRENGRTMLSQLTPAELQSDKRFQLLLKLILLEPDLDILIKTRDQKVPFNCTAFNTF